MPSLHRSSHEVVVLGFISSAYLPRHYSHDLKLATNIGIIYVVLVFQACKMQELWKIPPGFQRKIREARHRVIGSDSLQEAPERAKCEAVTMKLKMQWRLQEVRGASMWTVC